MHTIEEWLSRHRLALCGVFVIILGIIIYRSSQSVLDNLFSSLLWAAATLVLGGLIVPMRGFLGTARAKVAFDHYATNEDFPRNAQDSRPVLASRRLIRHLIRKARADDTDHSRLQPVEAALLMFAIQDFEHWAGEDPKIPVHTFMKLADRASTYRPYRISLLKASLTELFGARAEGLAEEIERKGEFNPVNISNTRVDTDTLEKLTSSRSERLYNVSATSQESNLGVSNLQRESGGQVTFLNFLVSPLCLTDAALSEMDHEYEIPLSLYPKDQFIPHPLVDRVRRVARIMGAITSAAHADGKGIIIKQFLCTKAYPGIRVRLLSALGTLQIRVAGLRYPNNLYRFGYSIDNSSIVGEFKAALDAFQQDKDRCREVSLDLHSIAALSEKATLECFRFLVSKGISWADIVPHKSNIVRTAKSLEAGKLLTALETLFADYEGLSGIRSPDDALPARCRYFSTERGPCGEVTLTAPGGPGHVSAGIIFESDGKLLMIRKRRAPHDGCYSIVAGHVKIGESAIETARREAREETGFQPARLKFETLIENVADDICTKGITGHRWYLFSSTELSESTAIDLSEREAYDYRWVPHEDIAELELTPGCRRVLLASGRLRTC